jgi:AcrR family transcriptional regulator
MSPTKKEKVQQEIIQHAKKIIHDSGFESLTVRRLAKETGFSYTNIYYYFKDLNTLFWELRMDMIEDMINELTLVPSGNSSPTNELIEVLNTYISYYFRYPNVFRFFYFKDFVQPQSDQSYAELETRFSEMWQSSFYRLLQENIIMPDDIEIVGKTIIYSLQGMIMLSFSSNGSMSKKDIENELVQLIHYLLKK